MIPDPKRHVEVLGGREELIDPEARRDEKDPRIDGYPCIGPGPPGSESKTKPIVCSFFSWGGFCYVSVFVRSCVCEIYPFGQMLMERTIQRFCQKRHTFSVFDYFRDANH